MRRAWTDGASIFLWNNVSLPLLPIIWAFFIPTPKFRYIYFLRVHPLFLKRDIELFIKNLFSYLHTLPKCGHRINTPVLLAPSIPRLAATNRNEQSPKPYVVVIFLFKYETKKSK